MRRSLKLVILHLFWLLPKPGFTEEHSTALIRRSIGNDTILTEKVYLPLDRPVYQITDTIRFKSYVILGDDQVPRMISGLLHVSLINELNKGVTSQKVMLTDGISWGAIALPKNYIGYAFKIQAYTNYMRNLYKSTLYLHKR